MEHCVWNKQWHTGPSRSKGEDILARSPHIPRPCESDSIRIQVEGNIVAPKTFEGWKSGVPIWQMTAFHSRDRSSHS
ncbi:hypothetical protein TIFTF001_014342 [Ficus carica]|uniref:Uncharacterized protein n=1 Tax=Ficus carica TaxID=3494 RepID=A0AA88A2K5_FICCA|nr:hypothetical protein TIFTF001_014342 [Ficus carica]